MRLAPRARFELGNPSVNSRNDRTSKCPIWCRLREKTPSQVLLLRTAEWISWEKLLLKVSFGLRTLEFDPGPRAKASTLVSFRRYVGRHEGAEPLGYGRRVEVTSLATG